MCQAVVEIVKHIAAEIQLCNPISHSNRKDWLLSYFVDKVMAYTGNVLSDFLVPLISHK